MGIMFPTSMWRSSMSAHAIETQSPLVFTEAAARKVKQLIDEEGNDALKLRVFISGGGCSGFQYGFTFDESINDGYTSVGRGGGARRGGPGGGRGGGGAGGGD